MSDDPRKILFAGIGIVFFALILVFAYGRFGRYINGPELVSINLQEYQSVDNSVIDIEGKVRNAQAITINGRPLGLDKEEQFKEHIVLPIGHTIIELGLIDSFNKQKTYTYNVYNSQKDMPIPVSYSEALKLDDANTEDSKETQTEDIQELLTDISDTASESTNQ